MGHYSGKMLLSTLKFPLASHYVFVFFAEKIAFWQKFLTVLICYWNIHNTVNYKAFTMDGKTKDLKKTDNKVKKILTMPSYKMS